MNCNSQCRNCGTCLIEGTTDDAEMECPRCRSKYGGGDD